MERHILIIDNDVINLKMLENTLKDLYKLTILISEEEIYKFLSNNKPDLILVHIDKPNMNIYEILKVGKRNEKFSDIPIIFLTDEIDAKNEAKGIGLGSVDYMRKPFIPEAILSRIKANLEVKIYKEELVKKVREKTNMIQHLQDVMVLLLCELVECRDENTGGHVKRTAKYVEILTKELLASKTFEGILTDEYARDIIRSAPLHDVGKIGINDATLLKAGSLDEDEFEYMKEHTSLGAKTLQKMIDEVKGESFLYIAKNMAHYHHEKWNGTGYPVGLKGEEIPLCARIMAVGDVYDALTTKRPYKEAFTHEKAMEMIIQDKGIDFDPKIIEVLQSISYKFKLAKEEMYGEENKKQGTYCV